MRTPSQTPLYAADGARAIDALAIGEHGSDGVALMRAAAAGAARVIRGRFADAHTIVVVAGLGGNGGDGIEVARLLRRAGRNAQVVRVGDRPADGASAVVLADAIAEAVPVVEGPDAIANALAGADLIVDALLGTGTRGAPRDAVAGAIEQIVESALPVVALDVPSGVDASTGEIAGPAVHADVTVAFHGDKLGLHIAPGRAAAGTVVVVPIGIPEDVVGVPAGVAVREGGDLLPRRSIGGSKYDAGAVLVIGGSVGMAGAPALVAAAALRAGAGVVTALVPEAVQTTVAGMVREAMVRPLPAQRAPREIARYAERATAVVLGPGLGRDPESETLVEAAIALDRPLVVDADALWWLARDPSVLVGRTAPTVITPHAGEAARVLGRDARDIAAHRLAAVQDLVVATGAVSLLKGSDTLVLSPEGRLGVRADECAGLATAGSGDVLAGIIGAYLAMAVDPWTAAIGGAATHVRAARTAVANRHGGAIIAGDLLEHLPVLTGPGSTP